MYNPSEILEFAVNIERNGEKFYRYAMTIAEDQALRETFDLLAREEVKHERIFAELLARLGDDALTGSMPDEYHDYLRAYVENVVFSDDALDEITGSIKTGWEALQFAMSKELDTILFYMELRGLMAASEHGILDQVIQEERQHYLTLARLAKDLEEPYADA